MTKEENQNLENNTSDEKRDDGIETNKDTQILENDKKDEKIEKSSEEKLFEIEDKLTRTLAEMENQRWEFP